VFSDAELKAIWNAANTLDPIKGAYVKLLMLLAPRKTALAAMVRKDLDNPDDPTLWTTPHELVKVRKSARKKRTYLTPLPPLARRILKGLPSTTDRLFPMLAVAHTPGRSLNADDAVLKAQLKRAGAPKDFTAHIFRHTVATFLQTAGHSEWEVGLALNHSGSGVTAGYSHGYPLELKRELLTAWSDHVERLVGAGVRVLR
jgi:integrase